MGLLQKIKAAWVRDYDSFDWLSSNRNLACNWGDCRAIPCSIKFSRSRSGEIPALRLNPGSIKVSQSGGVDTSSPRRSRSFWLRLLTVQRQPNPHWGKQCCQNSSLKWYTFWSMALWWSLGLGESRHSHCQKGRFFSNFGWRIWRILPAAKLRRWLVSSMV